VKWLGFIVILAAIMPLSWWLRRNPRGAPKIWILIGFLPFALGPFHLYMAIVSWPAWPGYVKGAEFSVLDALALSVYLSLPGAPRPLPFRLSMALYFLAVLLSTLQASVPTAALFYSWQLARIFLVYAVVTRGCADRRFAPAVLQGLAVGLFMEMGVAIWERFGLGELQTSGTVGHQNLLGLMSHLIVLPFFALLLATRGWLPGAAVLAGLAIQLLTTSRGTLGFAALGYAAVFMLSALQQWTSRKARLLFIGVAVAAIAAPLAWVSFEQRFSTQSSSDYDERAAFNTAASMILSDYPLGVGANMYVVVANIGGYNREAGVAPVLSSGSANVHNVYLLVAAETGYAGLITFVLLLLRPVIVAFHCAWRNRGDLRGDLMLGLGVGLLTVYLHCLFEWIFVSFQFQYIFAVQVGLVAGLAEQLGYWRRTDPQSVRLGVGTLPDSPSRETRGLSRRILK